MKLATSTGDFSWYVDTVTEKIKLFKGLKFKNINLEQTGNIPELFSNNDDDYKRLADEWGSAAAYAGVNLVVSHAPCIRRLKFNGFETARDDAYAANIRATRRSIEICHILGIDRIVIHACTSDDFSKDDFYKYNKMFYGDLLDLAEKYNIFLLTENDDENRYHNTTGKEIRDFIDYVDHPLLGACWDTAHGNIDPVARDIGQYDNIIALGDKLKGVHISDNFGDCHHHTWPFAGIISFDSVVQGLLDVNYDGYFTFEASYNLLHQYNMPYERKAWEHNGKTVTKLLNPSTELKRQATDLLYETGKHILTAYDVFEA